VCEGKCAPLSGYEACNLGAVRSHAIMGLKGAPAQKVAAWKSLMATQATASVAGARTAGLLSNDAQSITVRHSGCSLSGWPAPTASADPPHCALLTAR